MRIEKIMRIRQGVLKAKVVLNTATDAQLEEYEALVRLYGTHWTSGKVCGIVIRRVEKKLKREYSNVVDEFTQVLEDLFGVAVDKS